MYTVSDDVVRLQGESFPHSISPLFERRDLDLLELDPADANPPDVEIRNEALETHFINHAVLQYADHSSSSSIVPIRGDRPHYLSADSQRPAFAVAKNRAPASDLLREDDEDPYRTPDEILSGVTEEDVFDHLDLTFNDVGDGPFILSLRTKNTLLTTFMLYERMMSARGIGAIDWLNNDLNSLDTAVTMGDFFSRIMTMRVLVLDGVSWNQVATVGNAGPIAWERVGVLIPGSREGEDGDLRLRLEFIADGWMIDSARLHRDLGTAELTDVPFSEITVEGETDANVKLALSEPDESHLEMRPGSKIRFAFEEIPLAENQSRTYLWSSQGYYTEWVRGEWAKSSNPENIFQPDVEGIVSVLHRWPLQRAEYQQRFFSSKIPVN